MQCNRKTMDALAPGEQGESASNSSGAVYEAPFTGFGVDLRYKGRLCIHGAAQRYQYLQNLRRAYRCARL